MEKQKLQYQTLIYILAVAGLLCCCIAGFGILPAGIAYFIGHSELKKYAKNPDMYDNQDSIYTGKTIALIVLIINILYFGYTMYQIYTIGWDVLMEQSRNIIENS